MSNVIEIGNYIAPAYAGMLLAEQDFTVEKWTNGNDPILDLHRGAELWKWINYRKTLVNRHPRELLDGIKAGIVIDNFRPSTLAQWGIEPAQLAKLYDVVWVSIRSEVGEVSFDLLAQCRSWMEYAEWTPFYIGDTAAGLWAAFKAAAAHEAGHYVIGHASCMQKLVEGELQIDIKRKPFEVPWDTEAYYFDGDEAHIDYKGQHITETVKDREWKLKNLWHKDGRIII
jgi:hypothetical protein